MELEGFTAASRDEDQFLVHELLSISKLATRLKGKANQTQSTQAADMAKEELLADSIERKVGSFRSAGNLFYNEHTAQHTLQGIRR